MAGAFYFQEDAYLQSGRFLVDAGNSNGCVIADGLCPASALMGPIWLN